MLAGEQIDTIILESDWAITTRVEDGCAQCPRDPKARSPVLLICNRRPRTSLEAQCMLQKT